MKTSPGHFLIGQSLLAPADENLAEVNTNWLSRWQLVQKMNQHFWKKFRNEYLNELQQKGKWFQEEKQPEENELVLVKEENVAPYEWPMARVIKIHPGDDGLTRVVTLKMRNKIFQRPITKIAPLPIKYENKKVVHAHTTIVQPKKSFNIIPIILALLTLTVGTTQSYPINKPFNISRFISPPGLYFENTASVRISNTDWNVLSYISLNQFHDEFLLINKNIMHLREMCSPEFIDFECNNIISDLERKLLGIESKNELIFGKSKRAKRALLNIVGNLARDLFGVLDSRSAKEYASDIHSLWNNEEHLLKLI